MTQIDQPTIDTYNRSAKKFAGHFNNYFDGTAKRDVKMAFELAGKPDKARIVEIGCGAGKDTPEIIKIASWYEGFDPAEKLLNIARQNHPKASFVVSDASSYEYPENLDLVFAFASLLHVPKNELRKILIKLTKAIKPSGILCISLKESEKYQEVLQEDDFGKRQFYLYSPEIIKELAGDNFEIVREEHNSIGPKKKQWFEVFLKKV